MTAKQLKDRYGITIIENGFFDPFNGYRKQYDIYTADGCRWDCGFRTIKAVSNECEQWKDEILKIKRKVEKGA